MRAAAFVAVLAVIIAAPAAAQRPPRSGLWAESVSGMGFTRVATSGTDEVTPAFGAAFTFRIGGALSDRVLLGIENFGFLDETFTLSSEDTAVVAQTGNVAIVVVWFPGPSRLFLTGGVGIGEGRFTVTSATGPPVTARGTGVGLTFGVGFDHPISRKFSVTGAAGAAIVALGDVVLPASRVDDVIASIYHVGIGFTVR